MKPTADRSPDRRADTSLARRMRLPRTIGLALGGVCVGAGLVQNGTQSPWLWALLVLNGVAWPQVAYYWATRGASPHARERGNLMIDSGLGGFWVPAMGFNILPAALIIAMLTLDNLSVGGRLLFVRGLAAQLAGAAAGAWLLGVQWELAATLSTIVACVPFLITFPVAIGLATRRLAVQLSRQKAALEESGRLQRMTLDAMNAGIAMYDADDRLVLCNKDFRALYGPLADGLVAGRRFADIVRAAVRGGLIPQAAGREEAFIRERVQQHVSPQGAILRELPGDQWRRIVEQRLPDGSLLSFSTDVTDLVRRERQIQRNAEELRRARDEAVAASSAKSAFLANMSHEIRTPLTSIIGFGEVLLDADSRSADKLDAVHTIIRNGRHLLDVINDILDLSKIETGRVELERIPVDLPVLLRDLATLVAGRAAEKSLTFAVDPQLPLPATFLSDPVRVKQILLNFCGNAVKFTQHGGVRLEVSYAPAPPVLTFTVCDTGIGITPVQLSRLFQPFVQADASTTRRYGGSGLGLYLSRQLAQALGASIEVESRAGQGSRFCLSVPLDRAPPAGELLTLEGDVRIHERADFAVTGFEIPELSGRVLLAEDGVDNQRLLALYLKQAGLDVTVVGNGKDAVESALRDDFGLVLMDIQMPVLDGVEATRMLRAAGYAGPIIALTANVMKSDVQRYRDIGCDDVLAKPVERDRFYHVVRAQLALDAHAAEPTADNKYEREFAALTAQFRAGLPSQMDAIRGALAEADWDLLRSLVHTLKGTAGSYGLGRLTELSAQVEAELAAGRAARVKELCETLILEARGGLQAA